MKIALAYPNTQPYASQGPGWIASVVLAAGHKLDLYDEAYITLDEMVTLIVGGHYDLVLLSAGTLAYQSAAHVARRIKANQPDLPTLLGGLHATVVPLEVLDDGPWFDYLCVGEGEAFILEFLQRWSQRQSILDLQNLGYRGTNGQAHVNRVRPPTDLNQLPRFQHELWQSKSVVQPYPWSGFCYVYATRGCPYRCSYCANECYLNLYGRGYLRARTVDRVIAEMLWLKQQYPVEFFYFGDEHLVTYLDYCAGLLTRVHQEVKLPCGCMARAEHVSDKLVELLADTGCEYIAVGVECADEQFRREWLNRRMTNQQIVEAFQRLRQVPRIRLSAFCMQGWPVPYDNRLTEGTLRFVKEKLQPDIYQINTFFPFPGTRLYRYCLDRGLIDWDKYHRVRTLQDGSVLKPVPTTEGIVA